MPLVINHVSKSFGEKRVLSGLTLTVNDGERLCILGPSGGGKTTLLNIIAGLSEPDSGEVRRSGGKISYIFQESRLLPWLTALENITAAADCSAALAVELLTALELGNDLHTYPDSLSGGMKQRVSIARAMARQAGVILMDEPFKGLDEELRARVIEVTSHYCEGRTVILVTHDRRECELMRCGKILEFDVSGSI